WIWIICPGYAESGRSLQEFTPTLVVLDFECCMFDFIVSPAKPFAMGGIRDGSNVHTRFVCHICYYYRLRLHRQGASTAARL
ncbi:hypothetical protein NL533_33110, partial [Klebsiella pneumoniae]|nr:hypothetical protein [Klebsiella pneumoniae]